ncbi:NAD(P)/FAD-dependent oxidoreductase [Microbacterium sp. zg.Y1090]|uniref:NAD(P)/FAD-dependent oxidoreductase n=1 Tax=Microbacterium wangruii TaxID=3049073 RepID=UPI00214C0948|nr:MULTISPECIES: FAD/NAD(P)-binding oxidoreductase [unclassified Microbacterium]MCR2817846.1 NAD(P)/FAD-dependent oxidoreductase [Microbacterium sp. zg.Y1090]WIM28682.1 FAD/NAD(P)-binding oxidoreductase [Microbacterium sp. zg-Y1090]
MTTAARRTRAAHRVVVIGGGNAGLSVAGRLRRAGVRDVTVIEPRTTHVFAPLQSHIAGGRARVADAVRPQQKVTPPGVTWVQDAATGIDPDRRIVTVTSGAQMPYDDLVICPGIRMRWDAVPGLAEAMSTEAGVSNYDLDLARKASPALRDVTGGTVVFVQSPSPASCAAAAQKPMYLACDWWRARGVLPGIRVVFVTPEPALFHVAEVDAELRRKVAEYGIEVRRATELRAVDADARTITLGREGGEEALAYDLLHAEPPQAPAEWLASSGLTDARGYVEIDPETLRHRRVPSVWSLGDVAETQTPRSGGAIRTQSKVLVQNLLAALDGEAPAARYDGYSVCPFTVSRHTVVFAEFDRLGRPEPTLPWWKGSMRENRLTWIMDRYVLPWVYWHMILKGRA